MTLYFGVIGNRDYIKYRGERRPFWEFLDVQPDSWLTSLAYRRHDHPKVARMMWDCGAWSYKDQDVPRLGKELVTPEWALAEYRKSARPGDFVVAPDHMLIPGTDVAFRREWNRKSASEFFRRCSSNLTATAVIHGIDVEERLAHAQFLMGLGYRSFAVGGIAARAAAKKYVFAVVAALREITRGFWLHVLGLSSPEYAMNWRRMGVDSFDGASHFKQAFTAGAYYSQSGMRLIKHQAVRPGENAKALPSCDCCACKPLRGEGIDTRSYGSNENNMGRAAHNLNMLMRAHEIALTETVGLVACAAGKAGDASPAQDLYDSDLFRKSRAWCERNCDRWYILSARYGLVEPEQILAPYNETLNDKTAADRRFWGEKVVSQLGSLRRKKFILLAGEHYAAPLALLNADRPLRGLGIGQQLAWLKKHLIQGKEDAGLFDQEE